MVSTNLGQKKERLLLVVWQKFRNNVFRGQGCNLNNSNGLPSN